MALLDRVATVPWAPQLWPIEVLHRLLTAECRGLEMALRLDLPLATSDRQPISAAQNIGVPLLPTS